jgi:transcription elongation factor Elf1
MAYVPKASKLPSKCHHCGKRGGSYCTIEDSPVSRVVIGCKLCGHEFVKVFGAKAVVEAEGEVVSDRQVA